MGHDQLSLIVLPSPDYFRSRNTHILQVIRPLDFVKITCENMRDWNCWEICQTTSKCQMDSSEKRKKAKKGKHLAKKGLKQKKWTSPSDFTYLK